MRYKALTWDHPRGYEALRAAATMIDGKADFAIDWHVQPLEGFEAAPIGELCAEFDLVVLDHPHVGEAVAAGCLQPLETLFGEAALADIAAATIGPSFASYCLDGRQWALPLDAATQVMAARPELIDGPMPQLWEEVAELAQRQQVTLSLAGPHAALSFQSIAAAMDHPPAERDDDIFVSKEVGLAVLDLMARIASRMPASLRDANPIAILEHMARENDVVLCPLVYGYVNYAVGTADRRPVHFADAPRIRHGGRPGSTIGGTGIGISTRARITDELREHLLWLLSAQAQRIFIPDHAGQPSRRDAWADDNVNAKWGGFYRNTAATMESGFVRPRHDGAIRFQTTASRLIREGLLAGNHAATIDEIQCAYTASLPF